MKPFISIACVTAILTLGLPGTIAPAQHVPGKASAVQQGVDAKHFIFKARFVLPLSGGMRQLTPNIYDLTVTKDSVICNLPYFGRTFSATAINPIDVGLKFTTRDFEYSSKPGRKNSREILIRPNDNREISRLSLTVQENGSAYLLVNCNNRDPVSYQGVVGE